MNLATPHLPFRRLHRRAVTLLAVHAAIFSAVYFLAFFIRNDFAVDDWWHVFLATVGGVVAVKLVVFYMLGHMHTSWKRLGFGDLTNLLWAATLATLILVAIESFTISTGWIPLPRVRRSVILLDWAGCILAIGGIRALYRSFIEELRHLLSRRPTRVALIVGANQAGELIARNLMAASQNPYAIAGFLDDDASLRNATVAGIEVLGNVDQAGIEVRRRRVDDVIVQSGMLRGKRFRQLLAECTAAGATVKVLPAIDELLAGPQDPSHVRLRPVEIKDLLRREPVMLDDSAIRALIAGRTVMVTGAGGSIGGELCRQALRYGPQRLLLVERSENALFAIEQELARLDPRPPFEPLLADVTDSRRMEQIFATFRPDVVFHAAAHKHVPMMELNPAEAIKNNVLGTRQMAILADGYGVREFVSISTDKAVNPTSVMGCSKLLAERFVQAMSRASQTRFIVVRFGNVLASNGSVVPTFQEQIRRGGPITVTHPGIERYFMTIPEASQLVLQAASQGSGGEIFVLDMGESVKIVDLARDMIVLSGLDPDDIEIVYTGLRPGEKLFEELYFPGERPVATQHPKVFCAMHRPADIDTVATMLEDLAEVVDASPDAVRTRLRDLVPEYAAANARPASPATDEVRKSRAK